MRGNHVAHQYIGMELLINPHHACMRGNHVAHQYIVHVCLIKIIIIIIATSKT